MLNAKAVSNLLSRNSDERFCKRWFLMTLNGTLLAYTQPTNIKDLRKQAAMATLSWKEHQNPTGSLSGDAEGDIAIPSMPGPIHTLTIESDSSNLIIRKLQSDLLLVLDGGVPRRKQTFEPRATRETPEDAPYPPQDEHADSILSSSVPSTTGSTRSTAGPGILALQRRKMDALAAAINENFESTGFKMPEEGHNKFF